MHFSRNKLIKEMNKPFLVVFVFGGGCLSEVFSNAMAAAACCAFLIEGPEAIYSSLSPNFRQTVKDFLCAGPENIIMYCHIQDIIIK